MWNYLNRRNFITILLILNETLELKSRCHDLPTSVRRVKLGPLNGDLNVPYYYFRVKKGAPINLNQVCLVNETHYDNGNLVQMIEELSDLSFGKTLYYRYRRSEYIMVNASYFNETWSGYYRPLLYLSIHGDNIQIMDI